jgi:Flp pilus assembly protein TadB
MDDLSFRLPPTGDSNEPTVVKASQIQDGARRETIRTIISATRQHVRADASVGAIAPTLPLLASTNAGVVITAMPFVLAFVLYLMDPVLISRLWTTWLGWVFLLVMLALQITGGWMIRRFVTIRV